MLSFENDYNRGAHPEILRRFIETNMDMEVGYGNDSFCASAREKIRQACACPEAEVHFISGGTQTNAIVIDAMLAKYEGVVSAETGHIHVHESGAVEFTGHKILTLPEHDGKIDAAELTALMESFWSNADHDHMVFPGMVYISHPTERGTLYSKAELSAISEVCHKYELPLFMDGARMGYGLMSYESDLTLADIATYCDAFYIGGTKVGALCGEAVVFTRNAPKHFFTTIKQHGALLAKGRLLGIQFDTLFTDELYLKISRHAIDMAKQVRDGFVARGYELGWESPTNQQFIVLENSEMARLKDKVRFCVWEDRDANHTVVRFATSWATSEEDLAELWKIVDNK